MNDNSGFGGAVGLLVLLIALGAMNNGNGGIFGGGGNTASETAALVEQNNTARQVAANHASINNLLERVGGNVEATVRGFDTVGNMMREQTTQLSQLGAAITLGQRDIIQAQKDYCCATEKAIDRNGDRVLAWLNEDRDRRQQAEISDLKAEKSNYKQTDALKAYIDEKFACCKPACGQTPSAETSILFGMLSQMQNLVSSVATIAAKFTPATTATTATVTP